MARFPSKSAQSWKTLKNGCFWHCIVIIEWSRFFPGNPAVSLFFLYHPLTSCKKAKRSYARFSVTFGDGRTDRLRTYRSLTSTEVENCNVLSNGLNFRNFQCKIQWQSRPRLFTEKKHFTICYLLKTTKDAFWNFCNFSMILYYLAILPNAWIHYSVLSQYAISSWSNRPNSKNWPKTSFLALCIIQTCILVIFE